MKQNQETQGKIIHFQDGLTPIGNSLTLLEESLSDVRSEMQADREHQNALIAELSVLAKEIGVECDLSPLPDIELTQMDEIADNVLVQISDNAKCFPSLPVEEYIISALAGILSIVIDVIFVGTPEIVKIYRGKENFDGSVLTGLLRKIGSDSNGKLSPILQFFSDKCKVPYDISAMKGVVTPNNHRLRSLAHDPFLGLFFAVADIVLGTTTCIDN